MPVGPQQLPLPPIAWLNGGLGRAAFERANARQAKVG